MVGEQKQTLMTKYQYSDIEEEQPSNRKAKRSDRWTEQCGDRSERDNQTEEEKDVG